MKPDHLYIIQCGENGPLKIGISANVEKRLRGLQSANPYPLRLVHSVRVGVERAALLEQEFHRWFAPYRLTGEWFLPSEPVLRFVDVATAPDHMAAFGCEEAA